MSKSAELQLAFWLITILPTESVTVTFCMVCFSSQTTCSTPSVELGYVLIYDLETISFLIPLFFAESFVACSCRNVATI